MTDWLSTLLAVFAGGGVTMLSSWLADKRSFARERERSVLDRADRSLLLRNNFQRETLLALQQAAQSLIRATGEMHALDLGAHRLTGEWRKNRFGEELNQKHLSAVTDTLIYASRVRDGGIRELAGRLRAECTMVLDCQLPESAMKLMNCAVEVHKELIESIGRSLRDLDDQS